MRGLLFFITFLVMYFIIPGSGFAQEDDTDSLKVEEEEKVVITAVVLPFAYTLGAGPEDASAVTDDFRNGLRSSSNYQIISKYRVDDVFEDNAITGDCNEVNCALERGRLLDADIVYYGTVGKQEGVLQVQISKVNIASKRLEQTVSEDYEGDEDGRKSFMRTLAGDMSDSGGGDDNVLIYVGAGILAAAAVVAAVLVGGSDDESGSSPNTVGTPPGDPVRPAGN